MDCSPKEERVVTNRTPSDRLVVPFRLIDPSIDRIVRESDRIARQARRDCVPLPDFKIKRRRARR